MLESPWPILIVGLVLEAVLAIALFVTRRGVMLWAMGAVALLVLAGVLIDERTVTDTKLIRQTLEAAAAGLKADDAQRVNLCIVPDADGDRARYLVGWALGQAKFQELTIRNLEVKFNYRTSPPTAETTFTVSTRGTARGEMFVGEQSAPVDMEVTLRKESGRWLVYGEPKYEIRGQSYPPH
jgi:hypothetical protein